VMSARRANVQIAAEFAVKQHRAAFVTLGPQVLWRFAARENRVDPWTDVVGDPVHRSPFPALFFLLQIKALCPNCNQRRKARRAASQVTSIIAKSMGKSARTAASSLASNG